MLRSVGTGVVAMKAIAARFSATAHNVANVNTNGFKSQEAVLVEGQKDAGPTVHFPQRGAGSVPPQLAGEKGRQLTTQPLPSETDLAVETARSIKDKNGYAANAGQIRTADEMLGSLLSIRE
ncbi:flagellar basal body protein [Desulfobotulus sp. H1]|uniref:Flagellar basal body protein n=1 Tax=Desulfobotulus pelophilus TaxID=2823377 RepID=A0ABT3N837_9BACT|nr:flagellar basal body protein [Desulfobotulus pelophilus]MCW7753626.1 flagellar basal body protein [Desulfobotulus pelophilus]